MEVIKDNAHISFIGSCESVGNSFVSLNFAIEMMNYSQLNSFIYIF